MFVLSAYLRQFVRGAWENRVFVRAWDRACGPSTHNGRVIVIRATPRRALTLASALVPALTLAPLRGPTLLTGGAVESSSVTRLSFEAAVQLECPPLTAAAPVRLRVVRRVVLVRGS